MMEWLSVTQLSERLGIPPETIRRYINRHSVHLYFKKVNKSYYIAETSIDVLLQIRNLYGDGKQSEEVEKALDRNGVPMSVNNESDLDNVMVASDLEAQLNEY